MTHEKTTDRRRADRFPIEQDIRYKLSNKRLEEQSGSGVTVNMSSNGVLFTCSHDLMPGRRIEVSIGWPAQLNQKCGLRLVARGKVVRVEEGKVAMQIQQYEFKTTPNTTP